MLGAFKVIFFIVSVYAFGPIRSRENLSQPQCWSYKCDSIKSTCIYPSVSSYTYVVSPCSELSRPYCDTSNLKANTTCSIAKSVEPVSEGYPGEPCRSDSDCVSGKCLSRFCYGQVLYETCKSNLDCNPGLRCSNNICTTLLKAGKSCSSDFDCVTTAGCNNKLCTEYYSLGVNSSVSDCSQDDQSSMFCESGSCAYNSKLKHTVCIEPFISKANPRICKSSKDCIGQSSSGYSVYSNCECGMNWNGTMYCAANNGDDVAVNYRKQLKNFMDYGLSARCNTQRRFDKGCFDISYNTYAYEKLASSYYLYFNLPQLANISQCVKDVFFYELSRGVLLGIAGIVLGIIV